MAEGGIYVVKSNDALEKIAKARGITAEALRKANNLKNDTIRVGQKLTIPSKDQVSTVAKKERVDTPAAATGEKVDLVKIPAGPAGIAAKPVTLDEPIGVMPAARDAGEKPQSLDKELKLPAPEPSGAVKIHTVGSDEDLYSVAMLWGVSVAEIKKLNGLSDDKVSAGQKLKIPINE